LKIAVIIDHGTIQRFALESLDAIEGADEIAVFSCTNTRFRRKWLRHGLYYALNLLTVRNSQTRSVRIELGKKRITRRTEFLSRYEGAWQSLPSHIVSALNAGRFDVVLKFGMGLLRVPAELMAPILSFHHGDPDHYRGRPAGFWEITQETEVLGQIVQVISDRLDAGGVVAFAETKVMPWSYRRTLIEAFRHSPLIINTAIANAFAGTSIPKSSNGPNYRLPSNRQTIGFLLRMSMRFARRLFYGAFVEKRWSVSTAPIEALPFDELINGEAFPAPAEWSEVRTPEDYVFYADPFFTTEPPGLLVEGLDRRSGLGQIIFIDEAGAHRPSAPPTGHMSYPSVARIGGREIIVPETASWSATTVCALSDGQLQVDQFLNIAGAPRVTDPTLFEHENRIYLFGNIQCIGPNALQLWSSESLEGEFLLHPQAPIRISPKGGRMGGAIVKAGDRLVRFGQDLTGDYGNGLFAYEILALTPTEYQERPLGRIGFSDRKGPHTLNFRGNEIVFDWYLESLSPLAGMRRLAARRSAMANRGRGE